MSGFVICNKLVVFGVINCILDVIVLIYVICYDLYNVCGVFYINNDIIL